MEKVKRMTGSTLVFFIIVLACVLVTTGIFTDRWHMNEKNQEIETYRSDIQAKQDSNAALRELVDSDDIDDYAADIARNKLDYGNNNEKVYMNITGK